MSSATCAHLHVHSEYSLLDGACGIDALAARAAEFGQPALGLTDHGVMNGAVELYKACREHGIKPIVGCEVYVVDDRHDRSPGKFERNHLTLLAASDAGYRNLVKLSSAGFTEGLRRGRPAVDAELLSRHAEGVIALSGCLASRLCRRLVEERPDDARAHLDELLTIFGPEQVYMEVQKNGLAEQEKANEGIVRLAAEVGRPLVATGDVHYLRREDYHHHAALLCVQTKSTLSAPKMRFETNEFYLRSSDEMAGAFSEWPEAVASTLEIAERCEVAIELGRQLIPRYPTPDGTSERDYLRARVEEGLLARYGDPVPENARERALFELSVIEQMGFAGYFLIVWDFVRHARERGISVGPGRGSAAGSIVSFVLEITGVDPLHYDLLFERFLNPERVSMPDIDIDFSVRGREEVMRYVSEKYGRESVAQIVTFGRMLPKAATRDAARVLEHPYALGDELAKLIPDPIMGKVLTFEHYLAPGEPLAKRCEEDPVAKQIIDVARGLEGIVRNASLHAAAVVIADRPLTEIVPLQLADAGVDESGAKIYRTVTQFSMGPIAELGLLKMDFLGLRNLDVIEDALDIVERSTGTRPDMASLDLADAGTYEMLAAGNGIGVFQFESEGMRKALIQVRPTEFEDLVALNALYRPGAMAQIPTYARGKHDPSSVRILDERLRSILEPTKGVIVYQEQAMQIAKDLAGFSGARADDLRKAIGKKDHAAMESLKPEFFEGARASGTSPDVIQWLWKTNEDSANYSFNRSHAVCYALLAYRTAWLKANHPAEYMAALISSVMSSKDKVPFFVAQAEEMGLEILSPDVNESDHQFVVIDGRIRFGLDAVKGVGFQAVEAIKSAREGGGPFTSLWDFCARVDNRTVNKKAIEALVKCGALGSTGASRKGMLSMLEQAQAAGQKAQHDALMGQASIFDLDDGGSGGGAPSPFALPSHPPIPSEEFSQKELLAIEKEAAGMFISEHPIKRVRDALRSRVDCTLGEVCGRDGSRWSKPDGEWVTIGGIVTSARKFKARSGSRLMVGTLDDLDDSVDLMVFEKTLDSGKADMAVDQIVVIRGRVDHKDATRTCVIVQEATPFDPTDEEITSATTAARAAAVPAEMTVRLDATALPGSVLDELRDLFERHPGDAEVTLALRTSAGERRLRLGSSYKVATTAALRAELDEMLGPAVLPG